ncbi:2-hydroxyacyl-CoA dehydratase family protein [Oceanicola sp. 502str15]|uniref:2-hydroxyacyl-CoA dehydratase family protein n=1 Tax=Oceanicola sp. 502str15 TaxID=2696061 RepID=UPI0020951E79|nr:2-hydroxyacyl-CoA dehydratase family protein [Oceanicola sp. 502str15]MCO6383441.1 hypothetical protein [Oceanicola sp. 502str15]
MTSRHTLVQDAARHGLVLAADAPRVAVVGHAVPLELVLAAGCLPVPIRAEGLGPRSSVGALEAEHDSETRALFSRITAGDFRECALLIVSGDSDAHRFLFQYLKEEQRRGNHAIPPLHTFDILYTQRPSIRSYVEDRLRELSQRLTAITGREAEGAALQAATALCNAHRAALTTLQERREAGRVSGARAQRLIAKMQDRLSTAAPETAELPARPVRVLLAPALPLLNARLHQVVEAAGANITAEDDWTGARAAGLPLLDPQSGLPGMAAWYMTHASSPRMPGPLRSAWLRRRIAAGAHELLLFHMPPEDGHFGWEYPDLLRAAEEAGLPHLLLRQDVDTDEGAGEAQRQLAAALAEAANGEATAHAN